MQSWKCCSTEYNNLKDYLKHIKFHESTNYLLICNHCGHHCYGYDNFKNHLRKKHKESLYNLINQEEVPLYEHMEVENEENFQKNVQDYINSERNKDLDGAWTSLLILIAKFFVDLRFQHNIDQPTIDTINANLKILIFRILSVLKSIYIQKNQREINVISDFEQFMKTSIDELFKYTDTAYKQKKVFLDNYETILPQRVELGSTFSAPDYNISEDLIEKKHFSYYIPFIPSLQKLIKTLPSELSDPITSNKNIKTNVFDGEKIKAKMKRKNTLAIVLYLDDMEYVNIAGGATKIHKQSMFYWILLNLDSHMRFSFNNIQLLACAPAKVLKNQGIDLLLEDFISSINSLNENGIDINGEKYYAFLAFCMGDTLALQWLGGFVEGVGTAYRFCRNCEITYEDRKDLDPTIKNEVRTMAKHLCQLQNIEEAEDKAFYMKVFGVKNKSILLNIKDFDICTSLLQDAMHTLIEGVCIKEIKCLLKNLLDKAYFDLAKLNGLMLSFKYSDFDKNDLPKKFEKNHIYNNEATLSSNAGQILILMINLPLIIGHLIKNDDKNWNNFMNLNKIVNLSYSFTYEDSTICVLENLIIKYLQNFKALYEDATITPKMHYLTHLPQQLKDFGPLRHSSCFRFEAKNGLIKGMDFKSFKNLSFSITMHHQFWLSGQQHDSKSKKSIAYNHDIFRVDFQIDQSHKFWMDLEPKRYINKLKYLKINGFQYKSGYFLILNKYKFSQAIGLIVDILKVDDQVIFYLNEYKILKKDIHNDCLVIEATENFFYKRFTELTLRNAQYSLKYNNSIYLQVRYNHYHYEINKQ